MTINITPEIEDAYRQFLAEQVDSFVGGQPIYRRDTAPYSTMRFSGLVDFAAGHQAARAALAVPADASDVDAQWVQRLRETAVHLRENSLSLAKYPGMGKEARARELAALYIGEIAELYALRAHLSTALAAVQPPLAAQSEQHGDTGWDFRVNGGILHFADGSSRAATAPEVAMWKMLQAAPIAGDTGREAPTVQGLGTFACPVCGAAVPHWHDPKEAETIILEKNLVRPTFEKQYVALCMTNEYGEPLRVSGWGGGCFENGGTGYPPAKYLNPKLEAIWRLFKAGWWSAYAESLGYRRPGADGCRKCGGAMKPGKAMGQTFDTSDEGTCSPSGPGALIDCMKCSVCGWSLGYRRPGAAEGAKDTTPATEPRTQSAPPAPCESVVPPRRTGD